jgi:hypothetical protein
LDALHWRLYAVRADSPWRDEMGELWSAVEATHGPAEAWEAVVEAMLRDPLMVTY